MRTMKTQRGFALLESAIATVLISGIIVAAVLVWLEDLSQKFADKSGVRVAQYNSAVASWINAQGAAVPAGNYNGIGWLQNAATCAGATGAQDFIPCGWNDSLSFSLQFRTRIDTNATDPAVPPGRARAVTNLGTPVMSPGGVPRLDYGGRVILAAQAYVGISQLRAQNMVGMTSYRILPDPAGGANDQLIAQVDTATNVDPWLRIDGGNRMEADIHANGHNLDNARDVNATGTVRGQDLNASRDVNAGRDTNTARNASAGQDVNAARNSNAGQDVNAARDTNATRNATAGNDVGAGRDVSANNNPAAGGDVTVANTNNGAGNFSLSGAMQGTEIVVTDQAVWNGATGMWDYYGIANKPVGCAAGTIPRVNTSASQVSDGGSASPIGAWTIRADDLDAARWRVFAYITTAANNVSHSPPNNRIAVSRYCQS